MALFRHVQVQGSTALCSHGFCIRFTVLVVLLSQLVKFFRRRRGPRPQRKCVVLDKGITISVFREQAKDFRGRAEIVTEHAIGSRVLVLGRGLRVLQETEPSPNELSAFDA